MIINCAVAARKGVIPGEMNHPWVHCATLNAQE